MDPLFITQGSVYLVVSGRNGLVEMLDWDPLKKCWPSSLFTNFFIAAVFTFLVMIL
jgi:hypothetical protein